MARSRTKTPGIPAEATAGQAAIAAAKANEGQPRTQGEGASGSQVSDAEAPPTLNQIRYPCLMGMDYHATREAWLDQMHRWFMFAVIAAGASAFVDVLPAMRIAGPVTAVLAGALDLTFDLSNRARIHAMHRRRYADILSDATREPDKLRVLQCRLDELSGEEEPAFHAQLALSAMKAQQATYGEIVQPCRPGWFYRRFANIFRFDGHDFNES